MSTGKIGPIIGHVSVQDRSRVTISDT